MQNVDTRISDTDTRLSTELTSIKEELCQHIDKCNISTSAETGIKELSERESRKTNIVIFNTKESTSEDIEQRKEHDRRIVNEILGEMEIQLKIFHHRLINI